MKRFNSLEAHWQHFVLLVLISVIWGSSFILIKLALKAFTPVEVGTVRIFLSFVVLLPVLLFRPKTMQLLKKRFWPLLGVAIFGSGVPPFLFAIAQTKIDSSMAGMLNALVPIFTLLLGILFFGVKSTAKKIIGVLIGFAGSLGIILQGSSFSAFDSENLAYGLFVVLATICYGLGGNILKNYLSTYPAVQVTALVFIIIGPLSGLYLLSTDILHQVQHDNGALTALGYLFILSFMGTALALVMFNKLIQSTSALFASTVTYLIPGVAAFWGLLDGEMIGFMQIAGLLLIFLGIYLTGRTGKKKVE
ncbi:MAG: DMT family transporter [Chitinophagales bacterium]